MDLQRSGQTDVPEQVPFVKLVENQRADSLQPRIKRHLPQQDAFRHEPDFRALGDTRIEPNLVAYQIAQRPARFLCYPPGEHARGQASRLQHHDLPVLQKPMLEQHLGNLGRLAGTRWCLNDYATALA